MRREYLTCFLIFLSGLIIAGIIFYFAICQSNGACTELKPQETYRIYFIDDKLMIEKFTTPCCAKQTFNAGNWFDLSILILGFGVVVWIVWWAKDQGNILNEKFCIALIAFTGFLMYSLATYDLKTAKCDLSPIQLCSSKPEVPPTKKTDQTH